MSNIDKRALREIAEAAVSAHERLSVMPPDDIFDISLAEGTQLDADITALNALNSAANPTTVLALLDELEAAKQDASKWFKAFEKAVSVGARYEEQIAELEAREVVLPQPAQWDISEVLLDKAKVLKAIRDAGITVKGE